MGVMAVMGVAWPVSNATPGVGAEAQFGQLVGEEGLEGVVPRGSGLGLRELPLVDRRADVLSFALPQ